MHTVYTASVTVSGRVFGYFVLLFILLLYLLYAMHHYLVWWIKIC